MPDEADTATTTVPLAAERINPANTTGKKPICRYYTSKNGCRAGDQCRFQHIANSTSPEDKRQTRSSETIIPSVGEGSEVATRMTTRSTPVARPIPKVQTDDPRAFQLGQIQRRYKPQVSDDTHGNTVLKFDLRPSDPDFPYEIDALECVLSVPAAFPSQAKPNLLIKNPDIPRGFQINIERGFDAIAANAPNATLLNLMNLLDRQLESILSGKKAETIKIVANRDTTKKPAGEHVPKAPPEEKVNANVPQAYNDKDIAVAQKKRQSHLRQLEARFSRMQTFAKSSDGLTYTIPLDSPKRSTWPAALQSVRLIRILVPKLYPLEPAEAHFDVEGPEPTAAEKAFKIRSMEDPNATLTQQVNFLSQNLREMSILQSDSSPKTIAPPQLPVQAASANTESDSLSKVEETREPEGHLHYIRRPPEWDAVVQPSDSDEGDTSDPAEEEDSTAESTEPLEASGPSAPAERGILLSFPQLELHGIELLELLWLQITVKCERCKDTMDIARLRSSAENSDMRTESCKKCAATLAFRFRADMIHANAVRAGYLDLEGCTIVDMLPSNFIPTCAECSTPIPAPGVVAVRGDSALAVCRECHKKLSFRIVEVKFLHISVSTARASLAPGRKKMRENLGITAGTELPQRGRCQHYRKSYRWFRFSCCNKVFACDRCHDDQADHPNEWANRMLCGFCSREQNFRPEDCGICHASLTGKRGTGFWEGGKGTRDPRKMSRKDPRKYKRIGSSKK